MSTLLQPFRAISSHLHPFSVSFRHFQPFQPSPDIYKLLQTFLNTSSHFLLFQPIKAISRHLLPFPVISSHFHFHILGLGKNVIFCLFDLCAAIFYEPLNYQSFNGKIGNSNHFYPDQIYSVENVDIDIYLLCWNKFPY